jgi:hypothetical protein
MLLFEGSSRHLLDYLYRQRRDQAMCGADLSDLEEEDYSRKKSNESSHTVKGTSRDKSEHKT